ncbi:MAG: PAS domain-containing protein [Rhodospirillales bacterium]|nr:PAS domain-containing protein [Rhodospirillales bacterium]
MRLVSGSGLKAIQDRAEWLDVLDAHCGVGLWDAVLHEGDAMHPQSRWTWSAEFRRLCGYGSPAEFPDVVQSWSDRLHPEDAQPTFDEEEERVRGIVDCGRRRVILCKPHALVAIADDGS